MKRVGEQLLDQIQPERDKNDDLWQFIQYSGRFLFLERIDELDFGGGGLIAHIVKYRRIEQTFQISTLWKFRRSFPECFEAQNARKWSPNAFQTLFECFKASKNEENTLFSSKKHKILPKRSTFETSGLTERALILEETVEGTHTLWIATKVTVQEGMIMIESI